MSSAEGTWAVLGSEETWDVSSSEGSGSSVNDMMGSTPRSLNRTASYIEIAALVRCANLSPYFLNRAGISFHILQDSVS